MSVTPATEPPTRLSDYAPGRITVVAPERWDVPSHLEPSGVLIELPRYALDVRVADDAIDPERVRWLTRRSATTPLETRPVHLLLHRGALYVVGNRHVLAAHLAVGCERIPVHLFRPRDDAAARTPPARVHAAA